jgi:nucleoside-diphosphate-sugar epimerase
MLITGATGFIGSRLANLALVRGYTVKTLSRADWGDTPPVPASQRHLGSLPGQIPQEALKDVDVIAHCAAGMQEDEKIAAAVNVEGTVRLVDLAIQQGVETFIFLSSQSARPDALSAYGRTKYAAERALLSKDGVNIIILRPGLVTGPGSNGLYQRLSRMVESLPILPLVGGGRAIVQPIHVDDLCDAIFKCDQMAPQLKNMVLNLGHPQGVTLAEFLQAIALARLGQRKPALSIPIWLVEIAVRLVEALRIPFAITSSNVKGLKIVERMDTEADMARLNLILRPLEAMVQDSVC